MTTNSFDVGRWTFGVGRLIAIKIAISILFLTGCATAPRTAPRFTVPSTAPLEQAHKSAIKHIETAKTQIITIEKECPQAAVQINALSLSLDQAESELQTSEGARVQLQTELEREVTQANQLATDYDKASARITGLEESRHGWVKRFWLATAIAGMCCIWIFRRPLLMLIGAPFGI